MQVPCKEQRFCTNCKYFSKNVVANIIFYDCLIELQDYVTGEYETGGCRKRRNDELFCGAEAKYFEPKEG